MKSVIAIPALLVALALSACTSVEPPSRADMALPSQVSASQVSASSSGAAASVALMPQFDVAAVRVLVPSTLRVSEANSFHPSADIVWRGDAPGERHAQVAALMQEAAATATSGMTAGPKVVIDLEVTRFHCLTEKARFTVGGTHSMKFMMTVRDAATGAVLDGPRLIVADVRAAGGARAIAEDAAGRTQRVVVEERLAEVIRRELSAPLSALPADMMVTRGADTALALPVVVQR